MRKIFLIASISFLLLSANATVLSEMLEKIPGVQSVQVLDKGKFEERYVVMFEQNVSHKNPSKGKFLQRFVISHAGFSCPTLIVTEGYAGDRAIKPAYREEISEKLNTNQVFVEHRYFGKSVPSPLDWTEMTGENAAADLHAIRSALSSVYPFRWVAAGVSKGGQNTMIYATYFPDDVDAYVPYVGPVCRKLEDGRHEPFIASVGRQSERDSIIAFQREILSRRNVMVPRLEKFCKSKNMQFKVGLDEIFDLCVLEFSFSLWQWGTPVSEIPPLTSSDDEMFDYFVETVGPDYFMVDRNSPFFVQAAAELGYYGYDVKPFRDLLSIKTAKGYLHRVMLPEDAMSIKFSGKLSSDIYRYLKRNDPRMLLIYGETDPWSAAMPPLDFAKGKNNMKFYIQPRGSHRSRINTQPSEVRDEIWRTLATWLDVR